MKKILVIIIVLFTAIITMAYLYFSGLNSDQKNNESSLCAATANAAFIFSFQNDKSILDILKGQDLFQEIVGEQQFGQFQSLKEQLLAVPAINRIISKQNIYISLIPGKEKQIDLLYSTQINNEASTSQLLSALKSNGIKLDTLQNLARITLPDSAVFYLGVKDHLLLLSNAQQPVLNGLEAPFKSTKFIEYIKANSRLTKNSLAEVYINYNMLPELLSKTMPGKLSGQLSVLNDQNSFATLVYNFSKEKILLTGITTANDANSYYALFANLQPQKVTINNILPDNTANYTVYTIERYADWRKSLNEWFIRNKEDKTVSNTLADYDKKYHIDLDQIFPQYTKNQFISFQLSTTEKLGAIQLSNGDKVNQLLLDLSGEYSSDVKIFKDPDLLYSYFGEPFINFKRPFYTIIDNYMVFANNASTVQSFLNSYKNNRLLINTPNYSSSNNQLANTTNITFYVDFKNSRNIFSKNIYLPYYRQIITEKGLNDYAAFIYQLNGDNGKFQTNVLMSKQPQTLARDSLTLENDSLINLP